MILSCCEIQDSAGDLLLACLARGRGPTGLYSCKIRTDILANALRGSIRLKALDIKRSYHGREDFQMISGALANNRSL
jgi:hypothetical protein